MDEGCTGTANCPGVFASIDYDSVVVVGDITSDGRARHVGATIGENERAVTLPKAVVLEWARKEMGL